MALSFLDKTGVAIIWARVKEVLPKASDDTPKVDGTATAGTSTKWARADHVHPTDDTKVDKITGKGLSTEDYTTAEKNKLSMIEAGANNYTLPKATSTVLGGVKTGENIVNTSGVISVQAASTSQQGVVQLSAAINSTSQALAATPYAIKTAYDNAMAKANSAYNLAAGKANPATTLSGYGIADAYTKAEVDSSIKEEIAKYLGIGLVVDGDGILCCEFEEE